MAPLAATHADTDTDASTDTSSDTDADTDADAGTHARADTYTDTPSGDVLGDRDLDTTVLEYRRERVEQRRWLPHFVRHQCDESVCVGRRFGCDSHEPGD